MQIAPAGAIVVAGPAHAVLRAGIEASVVFGAITDLALLDESITRVLHLDRPTETSVGSRQRRVSS